MEAPTLYETEHAVLLSLPEAVHPTNLKCIVGGVRVQIKVGHFLDGVTQQYPQGSGVERNTIGTVLSMRPLASIRTVPRTQPLPSPPSGADTRSVVASLMVAASSRLAPSTTTLLPP